MSFLDGICVLILTYNEAPNIGRTLERLRAFREIVVLDSGSDDGTRAIIDGFSNTRAVTRPFDTHANQWNYGLAECRAARPWILALDADYLVSEEFVSEVAQLCPDARTAGYRSSFRYCVFGHPLAANLYPPVVTLFRREKAHYEQAGHTQRVVIDGDVVDLTNRIDHDDRKTLARWFAAQQKYAALEAEHLLTTPRGSLRKTDRIRLFAWPAPILVFVYTLLGKRCILDGRRGWFYVLQRTLAEIMIALELVDRRLGVTVKGDSHRRAR